MENRIESGDGVLRVQMLGRFAMHLGDAPVVLNKAVGAKSIRLLQMLFLSGRGGISKKELIDGLYGWSDGGDSANHNKNLNNLLYRLRSQLVASGLPDEEYVEIRDGVCSWKSSFPLSLDTAEFESRVREAAASERPQRIRLYREACERYFGELLPMNASEMWFYEKSLYFKDLYTQAIRELEQAYEQENDYMDLLEIYKRAAAVYPFDNWQTKQIRCYLGMYRYEEAERLYNQTMELYAREMGSPPTEEMQQCFEQLDLKEKNHRREIHSDRTWRSLDRIFMGREGNITKAIFGQEHKKGAYYCTYPSFVDYCRLLVRAKERYPFDATLMFLTLTQFEKKGRPDEENLKTQMELLKHAIGSSLRRGDAYTRYGNRHFILMLTKMDRSKCSLIFRRIEDAYKKEEGSRGVLWYHAAMTQELEQALTTEGEAYQRSEPGQH